MTQIRTFPARATAGGGRHALRHALHHQRAVPEHVDHVAHVVAAHLLHLHTLLVRGGRAVGAEGGGGGGGDHGSPASRHTAPSNGRRPGHALATRTPLGFLRYSMRQYIALPIFISLSDPEGQGLNFELDRSLSKVTCNPRLSKYIQETKSDKFSDLGNFGKSSSLLTKLSSVPPISFFISINILGPPVPHL